MEQLRAGFRELPALIREARHASRGEVGRAFASYRTMKYYVLVLVLLMLAQPSCSATRSEQSRQQTADASTLSLGMSHKAALEIIRQCGGQDITSRLAVVGANGEWPLHGLFWSLEQYNSVIEIAAENGNIVQIGYWTAEDFGTNKSHRAQTRRSLKSLTFNQQTRTLQIQVVNGPALPHKVVSFTPGFSPV